MTKYWGDIPYCVPPTKLLGGTCPPRFRRLCTLFSTPRSTLQHAQLHVSMLTRFLMLTISFFIASLVMTGARSDTFTSELSSAAGSSSGFSFRWMTLAGRCDVTFCGWIPTTILLSSTRRRSATSLTAYGRQPFCWFFTAHCSFLAQQLRPTSRYSSRWKPK